MTQFPGFFYHHRLTQSIAWFYCSLLGKILRQVVSVTLLLSAISQGGMADTYLVKDINPGDQSSSPYSFIFFNNKLYFGAADSTHGNELWVSDGTEIGTTLVKDIFLGDQGSFFGQITVFNNQLYFVANDGIHGNELWRSDGTAGGTTLVKDIFGGEESSYPGYFTVFNDRLYFLARNDLHGSKLWSSDGTEAGTVLIKDISIYYSPDFPVFTIFNNKLYFGADDGIYGQELWSSDGTEVGTTLVKDISPGSESSNPSRLVILNNQLYFRVGEALWSTDGTEAGTHLVNNIYLEYLYDIEQSLPSTSPSTSADILLNNKQFYVDSYSDYGNELWVREASQPDVMLKDIYLGREGSNPSQLTIFNNKVYFTANDGVHGVELWVTDGVPEYSGYNLILQTTGTGSGTVSSTGTSASISCGTHCLTHLPTAAIHLSAIPDPDSTLVGWSEGCDNYLMTLSADTVCTATFNKADSYHLTLAITGTGTGTVSSLGTPAGISCGTNCLTYFSTASITLSVIPDPGSVFTGWSEGCYYRMTLWADTTCTATLLLLPVSPDEGTHLVKDINPENSNSFNPYPDESIKPVRLNNKLYFWAKDGLHGWELWSSDGSEAGTTLVKDIMPGEESSIAAYSQAPQYNYSLYIFKNRLYFWAIDAQGSGLWTSDGTEIGTVKIKNLSPHPPCIISGLHCHNDSDYFDKLITFNDKLYFMANDGIHGFELWSSDGTEVGTALVKDIAPGSRNTYAYAFTVEGDKLYFNVTADLRLDIPSARDLGLWVSDGTEAGTTPVEDTSFSLPDTIVFNDQTSMEIESDNSFIIFNNKLYFSATDSTHGEELWVSDGTETGTALVKDIYPGNQSSSPRLFIIFNNKFYFSSQVSGYDSNNYNRRELWVSDGTEEGTLRVKPISPANFIILNDKLYFWADDGIHGEELWVTDGVPEAVGPSYSLTLQTTGTGSAGTVSSFGISPGIPCGTDCMIYSATTPIILRVSPSYTSTSAFIGWSAGCYDGMILTADTTCIATFEQLRVSAPFPPLVFNGASAQTIKLFTHFTAAKNSDEPLSYSVVANSNPTVVMPDHIVISEGNLTLSPGEVGLSTLTIQAQDWRGATVTTDLRVAVLPEVLEAEMKPGQAILPTGETRVSAAQFWGGWSVNAQGFFPEAQVTLADTVTVLGKIKVAPEDSGKKAEIVVYATYLPFSIAGVTSSQYLMLDTQGQVLSWDGKPENLVPFQRDIVLEPMQLVYAYQGQLTVPAKVDVYLGYRLEDGTLVSSQVMNLMAE